MNIHDLYPTIQIKRLLFIIIYDVTGSIFCMRLSTWCSIPSWLRIFISMLHYNRSVKFFRLMKKYMSEKFGSIKRKDARIQ